LASEEHGQDGENVASCASYVSRISRSLL
jgi:hypothetical protein